MNSKLFYLPISIFVILILSINLVVAFEIDNVKYYDEVTRTVKIDNGFGFLDELARIKLNTPIDNHVGVGYQKVAEMTFYNFKKDEGAIKEIELIDLKARKADTRKMEWKYKTTWVETREIKEVKCDEGKAEKEKVDEKTGLKPSCKEEVIGKEDVTLEDWIAFKEPSELPTGEVIVGLFTDVKYGDKVEWIPNFFGLKITEWATWTSDLSTGLILYYRFNETSAGVSTPDAVYGANNMTPTSAIPAPGGKIAYGQNLSNGQTGSVSTGNSGLNGDVAKSYCIWAKPNGVARYIFAMTSTDTVYFGGDYHIYLGEGAVDTGGIVYTQQWSFVCYTYNPTGTLTQFYLNGTNYFNRTASMSRTDTTIKVGSKDDRATGTSYSGTWDEFGIWNRTLTPAEITTLWNGGAGMTYVPAGGGATDSEYPLFTSPTLSVANGTMYNPNRDYTFNTTVIRTNGTVVLNFNGLNYTMTNSSTTFTKTLPNITAGTFNYYYYSYGNGTSANLNSSSSALYTITINVTALGITASPSGVVYNQTEITVTGTNCPSQLICRLHINNVNVTNPYVNATLPVANYTFIYNTTGNGNYTAHSVSTMVNVTALPLTDYPQYTTLVVNPSTPATYSSGATYRFNSTWIDSGVNKSFSVYFTFNGVNRTVTNSSSVYMASLTDLAVGTYPYYWYANDTAGFTNATASANYVVSQASSTTTLSLGSNVTYGSASTFTCTNNLLTPTMYVNGVDETANNGTAITRGAGTYVVTCNVTGNSNITGTNAVGYHVVSKATPTGSISITPSANVLNGTTTTATGSESNAGDGDVTYTLNRNGVAVANPDVQSSAVAVTYTYTYNSSGGQNYTSAVTSTQALSVYYYSFVWPTTRFNNSLTTEDILFSGNQNITRYIAVPQEVGFVTSAYMNLTGYTSSGFPATANLNNRYILHNITYYYNVDTNITNVTTAEYSNISSNMTTSRNGMFNNSLKGNALVFDGTIDKYSYVDSLTSGMQNNQSSGKTVCMMAYIRPSPLDGRYLFDYKNVDALYVSAVDRLYVGEGAIDTGYNITTNKWTHFCYTNNWTYSSVYVNGTKVFNGNYLTYFNGASTPDERLAIGSKTGFTVNLNGTIDEIAIWNRTLSDAEIAQIYNYESENINVSNINITVNNKQVFAQSGNYSGLNNRTSNFYNLVNEYLSTCTYSLGFCQVPVTFHSDTAGILRYDDMFYSSYEVIEESQSYNITSLETLSESFFGNFSFDARTLSFLSATLNYGGTSYAATLTNTSNKIYVNKTLPVSSLAGVNNLYWTITALNNTGFTQFNSSIKTQTVQAINLSICTAAINETYLVFSFKNETLLEQPTTSILSASFTYWLNDKNINKTYTFINATENTNYSFCFTPSTRTIYGTYSLTYDNAESAARTATNNTLVLSNSTLGVTRQSFFLLPTASGSYVSFITQNTIGSRVSGALIRVTKVSDGSLVEEKYTDGTGLATFWLDPTTPYAIYITKSGYDAYSTSITPTEVSYTFSLTESAGSAGGASSDVVRDISLRISPSKNQLESNTSYNFQLIIGSVSGKLDNYGFTLWNKTAALTVTYPGAVSTGSTISAAYDTDNQQFIIMKYFYEDTYGNTVNGSRTWYVINSTGSDTSLVHLFDNAKGYLNSSDGLFGIRQGDANGSFSLAIIIFLIIFAVSGVMGYKYGLGSTTIVVFFIFAGVLFFDVGAGLIPNPVGAVPNFPTVFMALILFAAFVREALT